MRRRRRRESQLNSTLSRSNQRSALPAQSRMARKVSKQLPPPSLSPSSRPTDPSLLPHQVETPVGEATQGSPASEEGSEEGHKPSHAPPRRPTPARPSHPRPLFFLIFRPSTPTTSPHNRAEGARVPPPWQDAAREPLHPSPQGDRRAPSRPLCKRGPSETDPGRRRRVEEGGLCPDGCRGRGGALLPEAPQVELPVDQEGAAKERGCAAVSPSHPRSVRPSFELT
jgi:hypothetical protein